MQRPTPPWRRTGQLYLALTMIGGAAALLLAGGDPPRRAEVLTALLLGLPGMFLGWISYRDARAETTAQVSLAEIADQLATALRTQWQAEAARRRLNDPHPLPVAWRAAGPDLVEPWDNLAATARGWPGGPPTDPATWAAGPDELAGSGNELAEALARVPTGRLLVLGEPGAGKTVLLVRLLLELLARRRPGDPVPVLVSLAGWDPDQQDLPGWLAGRLRLDHPGLALPAPQPAGIGTRDGGRGGAGDRVRALLDHRLLLPILDGLDELPETVQARAISRLNDAMHPGQGLVLASRLEPYRAAVAPATGAVVRLWGAAGIILRPLTAGAVRDYLVRDAGGPAAATRWQPVLDQLGTSSPVGRALTTPLLVGLARTIYNPRPGEGAGGLPDPAELCDQARFPTVAAVRAHLFDAFVPAAYRPHPDPPRRDRWTAAQAGRWLESLARHLERDRGGTTDLDWWELYRALPPVVRPLVFGLVGGLGAGFVFAVANGFTSSVVIEIPYGALGAIALGAVIGLWFGLSFWSSPTIEPARGLRWSRAALVVGAVVGVVIGIEEGPGLGLVFGLAAGLGIGLTSAPADLTSAADPRAVLTRDRRTFVVVALLTGLLFTFFIGFLGILAGLPASVIGDGLIAGFVAGLAFGLAVGLLQAAWGWFVAARCWLALRRRLPWRLMAFLDDAHRRGVLRQAGASYQFRHAELQRRLTTRDHRARGHGQPR